MTNSLTINFLKLRPDSTADIPLPKYMTAHSAGLDIYAAVEEDRVLAPGDISLIPTGFAMALPEGYEAQIRPRSGLAVKYGIGIVNSPGTIDADYRGEVMVPLINYGKNSFTVHHGERIAQMVIQQVIKVRIHSVQALDETERNTGGFGHTGI